MAARMQRYLSVSLIVIPLCCFTAPGEGSDAQPADHNAEEQPVEWLQATALRDRFADLSPDELGAVLTAAVSDNVKMIYEGYHTPEAFRLLQSDDALNFYIESLDEPLSPEWLDAFEDLLDHADYPSARLRAAALLLRYGRPSGFEYLKSLTEASGDLRAAEILVVAKQEDAIGAVIDALLRAEESTSTTSRIVQGLRNWDSPALDAMLSSADVRSGLRERRVDPLELASPAARSELGGEELTSAMFRWRQTMTSPDASFRRKIWAAAHVLRTQPSDPQATALLTDELNRSLPNTRQLRDVVRAIAGSKDQAMIEPLRNVLNSMAAENPDDTDVNYKDAFAAALEAFVKLGGVPSEQESQRWLDAHGKVYSATSYVQRVYLALLNTDSQTARQRLAALVGEEEASRVEQIQSLTPIPDRAMTNYLPRSSRGWVWPPME